MALLGNALILRLPVRTTLPLYSTFFKQKYENYSHWLVNWLGVNEPFPQNIFLKETKGACEGYINLLQHMLKLKEEVQNLAKYLFCKTMTLFKIQLHLQSIVDKLSFTSLISSSSIAGRAGVDSLLSSSNKERGSRSRNRPTTKANWQRPESQCSDQDIGIGMGYLPSWWLPSNRLPLPLSTCDKQILSLLHIYLSQIFEYWPVSYVNWPNPIAKGSRPKCALLLLFSTQKWSLKCHFGLIWLHICEIFIYICTFPPFFRSMLSKDFVIQLNIPNSLDTSFPVQCPPVSWRLASITALVSTPHPCPTFQLILWLLMCHQCHY